MKNTTPSLVHECYTFLRTEGVQPVTALAAAYLYWICAPFERFTYRDMAIVFHPSRNPVGLSMPTLNECRNRYHQSYGKQHSKR